MDRDKRKSCLDKTVVVAIIRYLERVSPGLAFMIDQYARYNYGKSFWWDILLEDIGEAFKILREFYSYRDEHYQFMVYEILRVIVNNNMVLFYRVVDLLEKGDINELEKLICRIYRR